MHFKPMEVLTMNCPRARTKAKLQVPMAVGAEMFDTHRGSQTRLEISEGINQVLSYHENRPGGKRSDRALRESR